MTFIVMKLELTHVELEPGAAGAVNPWETKDKPASASDVLPVLDHIFSYLGRE